MSFSHLIECPRGIKVRTTLNTYIAELAAPQSSLRQTSAKPAARQLDKKCDELMQATDVGAALFLHSHALLVGQDETPTSLTATSSAAY